MIEWVRIQNFKAIRDSGKVRLHEVNALIGNNGSGKSSIIEALQCLRTFVADGIDAAFKPFGGLEQARNNEALRKKPKYGESKYLPITIELQCRIGKDKYRYEVCFTSTDTNDIYEVKTERMNKNGFPPFSEVLSSPRYSGYRQFNNVFDGRSLLRVHKEEHITTEMKKYILQWQFLNLNAHTMGFPYAPPRAYKETMLLPDGINVASMVSMLADQRFEELSLIVERMKYVLPDLVNLQPEYIAEVERKVKLMMSEHNSGNKIPGWLLSFGTLRILAFLIALNSSVARPTVLFIEEIENGIDPRTLNLLIEEIHAASLDTDIQTVFTTHSPYCLDLLDLRHIIVAERQDRKTVFFRPEDNENLAAWKEKFSPGKLYTMNKLRHP